MRKCDKYCNNDKNNTTKCTAAYDAFDWVCEIGDIANRRYNKHIAAARIGRDGRQQLTVNECTHSHRHHADVHVSKFSWFIQRRWPVRRRSFGHENDRQPQNWVVLPSAVWCRKNIRANRSEGFCEVRWMTSIPHPIDGWYQVSWTPEVVEIEQHLKQKKTDHKRLKNDIQHLSIQHNLVRCYEGNTSALRRPSNFLTSWQNRPIRYERQTTDAPDQFLKIDDIWCCTWLSTSECSCRPNAC